MNVEPLAQRVVELIEGTAFTQPDSASIISMIALVLAGAGLVTLRNFSLGGRDQLPLLVAEPFPRVEVSIGVVPAMQGISEALSQRLRRHAQHPSVDALVVATTGIDAWLLPHEIDGVPLRTAILLRSPTPGPAV